MQKHYKKALFVFRRDLRIQDNTGLLAAIQQADSVIPCFIFDPVQVGATNTFRSMNALQFMIESLQDLEKQLKSKNGKLYLFYGNTVKIINTLIKQENIDAIFVNRDYTPFSLKRDESLKKLCYHYDIAFEQCNDLLLTEPEEVLTQSGTPYSIFSAFYKKARIKPVEEPHALKKGTFFTQKINNAESTTLYKKILNKRNPTIHVHGGTDNAKKILRSITNLKNYAQTHNIPSLATSNLSAHIKFGTISIRHIYHTIKNILGSHHPLIRQLYWRDFFTHVAYNSPFVFGQAYHNKYNNLAWSTSKADFKKWCTGTTGFPIVDAGMRQLNATGFMHNRVRMIAASFLVKDLHINWQWGEKYFAQQLIDYDPAVNNGNWQWVASTGCDAQPYFRIFNPWLQQKKFDKNCTYIKKWVQELRDIAPKTIHTWFNDDSPPIKNYPRPLVDHDVETKRAKALYKEV